MDYSSKDIARFWKKVDKSDDCWNWTAAKTPRGYGVLGIGRKTVYAHRISFEIHSVAIQDGIVIDHTCHNTSCVNPSHLRACTQKQNTENKNRPNDNNRSSGIRGVTWDKHRSCWRTQVMHNRKGYSAGRFDDLSAAAEAVVTLRNQLHTCNDSDRAS